MTVGRTNRAKNTTPLNCRFIEELSLSSMPGQALFRWSYTAR